MTGFRTDAPAVMDPLLARVQRRALAVGLVAAAICVLGAFLTPAEFYRSYLFAYLFWLGLSLGSLAVLMLQHLTGGRWGLVIRRPLEASGRLVPLMALLFLPIILGAGSLYTWSHAGAAEADEGLGHRRLYLNLPAFVVRAVILFAIWAAGSWLLSRWSADEDRAGGPGPAERLRVLSGPGLVLYVLTMTVATVDWVMSIDPHWYSTIFGLIVIAGQGVGALSAMILVLALLRGRTPLAPLVTRDRFHDLGNLLMSFVMLWAYMQFSQFLIIWMGNLPEETPYYVARLRGSMGGLALAVVLLHFAVPMIVLLSRDSKRSVRVLGALAAGLLLMRLADLFWIVKPMFVQAELAHRGGHAEGAPADPAPLLHWLDFVTPVAIGGIWVAVFVRELVRRPLVPVHDARLARAAAGEPDHG